MLRAFDALGSWLRAIPGPTEHWATILAAWAWPVAILLIVYMLRTPISSAAGKLADRFERDDIEVPGFLRVTGKTSLSTLKDTVLTEAAGDPEAADAKRTESLLEFAGESEEKAERLVAWMAKKHGSALNPEEFLTAAKFAEDRVEAYDALIGGAQRP